MFCYQKSLFRYVLLSKVAVQLKILAVQVRSALKSCCPYRSGAFCSQRLLFKWNSLLFKCVLPSKVAVQVCSALKSCCSSAFCFQKLLFKWNSLLFRYVLLSKVAVQASSTQTPVAVGFIPTAAAVGLSKKSYGGRRIFVGIFLQKAYGQHPFRIYFFRTSQRKFQAVCERIIGID